MPAPRPPARALPILSLPVFPSLGGFSWLPGVAQPLRLRTRSGFASRFPRLGSPIYISARRGAAVGRARPRAGVLATPGPPHPPAQPSPPCCPKGGGPGGAAARPRLASGGE